MDLENPSFINFWILTDMYFALENFDFYDCVNYKLLEPECENVDEIGNLN